MATKQKTPRVNFASIQKQMPFPDFLDIQLKSFQEFFKMNSTPEERKNEGLYKVFTANFPITDQRNIFELQFVDYTLELPKYSIEECLQRGLTYSAPLRVRFKLVCNDAENTDFAPTEQDVYLGSIPYMTPKGTFVINGAERVVVTQLHRSPGVFFSESAHTNGTKLYSARIIPLRGSWIEFSTDINDTLYAYIDRKKKLPLTTLLRAIGYETDKEILDCFGIAEELRVSADALKKAIGRQVAGPIMRKWNEDYVDESTGEVSSMERNEIIVPRGAEISEENIKKILEYNVESILLSPNETIGKEYSVIFNTLQKDPTHTEKEAIYFIYRELRSAEPADDNQAREVVNNLFFSEKRYDLGEVGRYRINRKLGLDMDNESRVLSKDDIISIIKYLVELKNQHAELDDIDHLSNRRVRTVGEQLSNQFGIGLIRMSRTVRERMNVREGEKFEPSNVTNAKAVASTITSFFGTNPLSQFMDQQNPLAEITHKRRLSALGPGGLTRDRAGFEVRDVHYTHYGRLCPIETPEGPNIGLISSLCIYAKVNNLGFIETPYRKVSNSIVDLSDEGIQYMMAEDEEKHVVAQGNAPLDNKGHFIRSKVKARYQADFPVVEPDKITLMDVAPSQIASIAAALIPFLEHDDANRALMGSNMMRQAVPLLRPEAPIVGTGIEGQLIQDSRTQVIAEGNGVVTYVDADCIRIKYDRSEEEEFISFNSSEKSYKLTKFLKTNQNTTIDLHPLVRKGDRVEAGQILTEGFATQDGELALGKNLKVAYIPWKGYNYEDAIVLSERIVREDMFTSVHVVEELLEVRETKNGRETFTSDIPNVGDEAIRDLDENGIIRIGAHVEPGDIMIGKITPKGESDPTPEEKLLRAIFGDKAGDVKDASKKANASLSGIVIGSKIYEKKEKTRADKALEKKWVAEQEEKFEEKVKELRSQLIEKLLILTEGKNSVGVKDVDGTEVIRKNTKFTREILDNIDFFTIMADKWTSDEKKNQSIRLCLLNFIAKMKEYKSQKERENYDYTIGDELPTGVLQLAKVYIAKRRKIRVGDKMAGRHGNKGIVSKIVRVEDMPFLADGTPVDIVLNPLGVPSRMNIGQIFEAVLGWAGKELGVKFATPIFDGCTFDNLNEWTDKAGLPRAGKTILYDGGTGEQFDQPATVGVTYFMKLGHMVDDKMHARSIGPYSLITQQPLGGKASFGGQRFGEMEVWALEAHGASHVLQEILTVKSDDVTGRSRTYEAIAKGEPMPKPGIPEALNVLLHELQGLALSIKLE